MTENEMWQLYKKCLKRREDSQKVQFDDEWKTIKGTHVLIDDYGRISKGPAALKLLDKWERKAKSKKSVFELGDEMKPRHSDYDFDPKDDIHGFIKKKFDTTKEIYEEQGMSGVEDEWFKQRLSACTKDLRVVSDKEIDKAIDDSIDKGKARLWLVEYDHRVKPELVRELTSNPEIRNAALNIMYKNYVTHTKYSERETPLSFEEFLVTPIKMYRGGSGKEREKPSAFSSYTFSKKAAARFKSSPEGHGRESDAGRVWEGMIRPIDTYGSLNTSGEMEIFVPRAIAPNGRFDSEKAIEKSKDGCYNKTNTNFDAEDETNAEGNNNGGKKGGGHGNTRIPYGLCQREGIEIQSGWTPKDAWKALEGKGYSAGSVYKELKKTGKVGGRPGEKPKKPKTHIRISSFPDAMTKKGFMENTLVAVNYVNSHCDDGAVTDFLGIGGDVPEPQEFLCRRNSTGELCQLDTWGKRSTGDIVKAQLVVPKFSAYDDEEERKAAIRSFVHEWTHYLDYASWGWKRDHFTLNDEDLKSAVKSFSVDKISNEAKGVFEEYNRQYDEVVKKFYQKRANAQMEYAQKKFGSDKSRWPSYIDEEGYVDYTKAVSSGRYYDAEKYEKEVEKYKKELERDVGKKNRALMDGAVCLQGIYDSLSGGKLRESGMVKFGHSVRYFREDPGNIYAEALADYVALKATNPELAKVFSDNFPDIAMALDNTMDKMVKKARGMQ